VVQFGSVGGYNTTGTMFEATISATPGDFAKQSPCYASGGAGSPTVIAWYSVQLFNACGVNGPAYLNYRVAPDAIGECAGRTCGQVYIVSPIYE
jgi:hypothetical protein